MLVQWNHTSVAHSTLLVHQLFEQQALATPNAPAILTRTDTLTYAEV